MAALWSGVALVSCLPGAAQAATTSAAQPFAHATDAVRSFEPDSFGKIIAAHRGQAFVVIVWSLDCEYCLASFKTLEQTRRKSGMPVVAIATDSAADPDTAKQVREKIRAGGLRAQTWAFGEASAERLRHAIDPKWRGEMPRSYWFDAQGRMAAWSGLITPEVAQRLRAAP